MNRECTAVVHDENQTQTLCEYHACLTGGMIYRGDISKIQVHRNNSRCMN